MFGRGVKLGTILGIEIWVDYSWLIIFFLLLWSLSGGFFPSRYPGLDKSTYFILGAMSAILLFACVLLHELSHSYVAQKSGIPVPRITLFIFGGVAQISEEPKSARMEFNIAVAGPICSLILAVIFWALTNSALFANSTPFVAIFDYLAFVNLALVIFNMIPGFPLDGGRILRAYLWGRWNNIKKATYIVSRIGSFFGIGLAILGGIIILMGNLIGGIWFIFIGLFLNNAAKTGYQMTVLKHVLEGVKVKDVMTREIISVFPHITLSDLVQNQFYLHIFVSFPVIDDSGNFLGMVSLKQVKEVPQNQWHVITVREIMTDTSQIRALSPWDDASDLMSALMLSDMGRLPVLDSGKLVGIVTRRDILTLLTIRSGLEA